MTRITLLIVGLIAANVALQVAAWWFECWRVKREVDRILRDARSRTRRVVVPMAHGTLTVTFWEETWLR